VGSIPDSQPLLTSLKDTCKANKRHQLVGHTRTMAPEPQTEAYQIPVENIMYVPASCVRWVRALRYRSLTRIGWPSSCCLDQPVLARRFWPSSITSPTKGPNIYLINAPWVAFMDRCDLACSFLLKWNDRNKKKIAYKVKVLSLLYASLVYYNLIFFIKYFFKKINYFFMINSIIKKLKNIF
jgi:hypothetical protein